MVLQRHLFGFALVLSLALHLLLLWQSPLPANRSTPAPALQTASSIGVLLRPSPRLGEREPVPRERRAPVTEAPPDAEPPTVAAPAGRTSAESASRPPPTRSARDQSASRAPGRPLDLRLPEMETDAPESGAGSARGGAIFDQRFARRLRDAREHSASMPKPPPQNGTLADNTRMGGGQWVTFVRIGRMCFEIIEADPLDALSREQWYPVECPS